MRFYRDLFYKIDRHVKSTGRWKIAQIFAVYDRLIRLPIAAHKHCLKKLLDYARIEAVYQFTQVDIVENSHLDDEAFQRGTSIYYADAFRFCAQLVYDGYDDWRLPTVNSMHIYVQQNLQDDIVIANNNTAGWSTFWCSAMHNNPSASMNTNSNLGYNVPIVNISGPNHETLPNQILFYGAMSTYSMINCFCVR